MSVIVFDDVSKDRLVTKLINVQCISSISYVPNDVPEGQPVPLDIAMNNGQKLRLFLKDGDHLRKPWQVMIDIRNMMTDKDQTKQAFYTCDSIYES